MIELSRTQDEEVGDGTTSVIILSGELLSVAQPFLDRNMHPRHIVGAYVKALDESLSVLDRMCVQLDVNNRESMLSLVRSCIGTKFVSRFGDLVANLAIDAVLRVTIDKGEKGGKEIDIKRYARVEKVPGGMLEESHVLDGVMLNKDVVHPGMRRRIENPRIMLLDCPLEYKKAESQTNLELKGEADFEAVLRQEEDFIKQICDNIIKVGRTNTCIPLNADTHVAM
jgi:T-complex protein 1 subunit gamma